MHHGIESWAVPPSPAPCGAYSAHYPGRWDLRSVRETHTRSPDLLFFSVLSELLSHQLRWTRCGRSFSFSAVSPRFRHRFRLPAAAREWLRSSCRYCPTSVPAVPTAEAGGQFDVVHLIYASCFCLSKERIQLLGCQRFPFPVFHFWQRTGICRVGVYQLLFLCQI